MKDNQRNTFSPDQEGNAGNHQKGRELYNREQQRNQPSGQHHGQDSHWDAGNHFHTGYSNQTRSHFPEDSHQRSTNADRGGSLNKHYGSREYSTYRNPNTLNYGDGRGTGSSSSQREHYSAGQGNSHFAPYGDNRGNYSAIQDSYGQGRDRVHADDRFNDQRRRDDSNENYYQGAYMDSRGVRTERPLPEDNPYNEYPGSRSRYKDDDYRYGSGNHGWYQEQRYTANDGRVMDRDKGGILGEMGEGLREAWHDVTNLWNRNTPDTHRHESEHRQDRDRHQGSHRYEYRSPQDRGLERGPRWSDETDNGEDSFFYGSGNPPRYY